MSQFKKYKDIIFDNETKQHALILAVQNYKYKASNFDEAYENLFLKVSELHLQKILAPFLRQLAMDHLSSSEEFANAYEFIALVSDDNDPKNVAEYVAVQSKNYKFASEQDARALAQALNLNCTLTFTHPETNNAEINPSTGEANFPTMLNEATDNITDNVHLYYERDAHYFIREGEFYSTFADGNCLYHAFAQHLRAFIKFEKLEQYQLEAKELALYQHQLAIQNQIKGLKPLSFSEIAELAAQNQKEHGPLPEAVSRAAQKEQVKLKEMQLDAKEKNNAPSELYTMMLKYQAACKPILIGLAAAALVLALSLTLGLALPVAATAAITIGAFVSSFNFFTQPSPSSDEKIYSKVNSLTT